MAKGYWIVRVDIDDLEQYKKYIAANAAPFNKFGASFWCAAEVTRRSKAAAAPAMW